MFYQGAKAGPGTKVVVAIVVATVVVVAGLLVVGYYIYKRRRTPIGKVNFASLLYGHLFVEILI